MCSIGVSSVVRENLCETPDFFRRLFLILGGYSIIKDSSVNGVENKELRALIKVRVANENDAKYASEIADEMEASAKARGTGIAKRSPDYLAKKMEEGKAVIALKDDGTWVGFCYIEAWGHGKFVANSGLIVAPPFRKTGVATEIKQRIFNLSRQKFPESKIFGLTTGLAVMKMNSELGYVPVTYSELTDDEEFWSGCRSCVNFDILTSKQRKNCLCTGMLYDPSKKTEVEMKKDSKAVFVDTAVKKKPLLERLFGALREKLSKRNRMPIL